MHEEKYLAFVLDEESKARVLNFYRPVHDNIKCEHVTIERTVTKDGLKMLGTRPRVRVYGGTFTSQEVDCIGVLLNFNMKRPDGKFYHLTLAVGSKGRSKHSNDVMEEAHKSGQLRISVDGARLYETVRLLEKGPE